MPNTEVKSRPLLHVAVGVVRDHNGRILIALRGRHQHQGNLWEFPGGKVEPGESCADALVREFKEEVDIDVLATQPLTRIEHHYDDKSVLLDVHYITEFRGRASGREGQPLQWVASDALADYQFPAANRAILHAIKLPSVMAITGDSIEVVAQLQGALAKGAGLLQLRMKSLPSQQWLGQLAAIERIHPKLPVVVNSAIGREYWADLPGLHLTSVDLMSLSRRPVDAGTLLGASCHSHAEVSQARVVAADYIVISPVAKTASHPDAKPLGWDAFADLAGQAHCPAFALGGLSQGDLALAQTYGGHGIAARGAFWS